MKASKTVAALALGLSAALPAGTWLPDAVADSREFVVIKPGQEAWQEYPGIRGIGVVTVYGDLKKAGPYVVRVRFSPGTMSMPHYHQEDRQVAVLKGTWYTATSPDFEPWNTEPLPQGSYMLHPALEVHYDGAKDEEVILQISGVGPTSTTFLDPEHAPVGNSYLKKP